MPLTLQDVEAAGERIAGLVNRTPVMTSQTLDRRFGAQLFFKCENLQKCGVFKARGAANAVFNLPADTAAKGVATHSSGNHAAALARAAALLGVPAHVVMPIDAPRTKREAVLRYGGLVIESGPSVAERERGADEVVARTGAVFIHPYDNLDVMAGAGVTALELHEQVPDLDLVVCPVGGGGLLSGVAAATKGMRPACRVVAAEPQGADDAKRSFAAGRLIPLEAADTLADGLRTSMSELTFAAMQRYVDEVVTVSDAAIVRAMRLIWEVMKIVVEPSAAVPLAAILSGALQPKGRVGLILSGGNLDLDHLPWTPSP